MKLWGGRFTKEENQLVHNFNESLSFDQKFYAQDIRGSIAHVKMLGKQNIISEDEMNQIIKGLEGIKNDIDNGNLVFTKESEDIHSFVEANLIERIGDAGKKLHTGRSRNDQVALDMKLYTRDEVIEIKQLLKDLLSSLLKVIEQTQIHLCLVLHICRKLSLLLWLIILELTLKCLKETETDLMIFTIE